MKAACEENQKKSRKRPRSGSSTPASRQRRSVPPPPKPPEQLVRLLRSNSQVLAYFRGLHANLEGDVDVWKGRAKEWETKYHNLKEEFKKLEAETESLRQQTARSRVWNAAQNGKNDTVASPNNRDNNDDSGDIESKKDVDQQLLRTALYEDESPVERINGAEIAEIEDVRNGEGSHGGAVEGKGNEKRIQDKESTHETGVAIQDSMFELESSSEDEDENDEEQKTGNEQQNDDAKHEIPHLYKGRPIEDAMFALDSSSSDEDDTRTDGKLARTPGRKPPDNRIDSDNDTFGLDDPVTKTGTNGSSHDFPDPTELLMDAFQVFESLGIPLVNSFQPEAKQAPVFEQGENGQNLVQTTGFDDVAGPTVPADILDVQNDQTMSPQPTIMYRRRPYDQLAADLFFTIHSLARVQITLRDDAKQPEDLRSLEELLSAYAPFSPRDLRPACDREPDKGKNGETLPTHPLISASFQLFRALLILDTYCDKHIPESVWTTWFSTEEELENSDQESRRKAKIGLRFSKDFVRDFMQSVHGEIAHEWPAQDRSWRLSSPVLQLRPADDATLPSTGGTNENANSTIAANHSSLLQPKSQNRLSTLLERCLWCRLLVGYHLSNNDPESVASLFWEYMLSAAPSFGKEDYPKLPPVLSFVVLEAMIIPLQRNNADDILRVLHGMDCPNDLLWNHLFFNVATDESEDTSKSILMLAKKAISLGFLSTAVLWYSRVDKVGEAGSSDSRIRNVARVELAAFDRLTSAKPMLAECKDLWKFHRADEKSQQLLDRIDQLKGDIMDVTPHLKDSEEKLGSKALELCFILSGTVDSFQRTRTADCLQQGILVESRAMRQLETRLIDSHRMLVGVFSDADIVVDPNPFPSDPLPLFDDVASLALSLESAAILSDGEDVVRRSRHLLTVLSSESISEGSKTNKDQTVKVLASLRDTSCLPVARVINLKTRSDRWRACVTQAMAHEILLVRAVARLDEEINDDSDHTAFFGSCAWNGVGRWAAATERVIQGLPPGMQLDRLVATHWRPHDLIAFDCAAPKDENLLVRSSPTERACALSHIASWKGVLRSLCLQASTFPEMLPDSIMRRPKLLWRAFHIAGFASGPSLMSANLDMSPTPVCLILEDDALLVERFRERLQSLLEELPRDFHFCSLGYSRPKTAPIIPYLWSAQSDTAIPASLGPAPILGIPSHTFYMTGYLLSESGARYLLDQLPVVGPVDSWIGLKMTLQNFDNDYGAAVGVGRSVQPWTEPGVLSRKDLTTCLKFRAFCALQPLCSQKVSTALAHSTQAKGGIISHHDRDHGGRSTWRSFRDTDIEYSGSATRVEV